MTTYRKSRIRNAANRLKDVVMADGKIDVVEAGVIRSFVAPLAGEAKVFAECVDVIDDITKDGSVDFDEQVTLLKIVNRLLAYLSGPVSNG